MAQVVIMGRSRNWNYRSRSWSYCSSRSIIW